LTPAIGKIGEVTPIGEEPPPLSSVAIPFHKQTFDFTCGPACLIMAMRYFDSTLEHTSELEIDIWRESNLVEAYATSRQGLALAAHRRGFRVCTQGNAEAIELLDCLGLGLNEENRKVAFTLHQDLKDRCRREKIPDTIRQVSLSDISSWLTQRWGPLVLVDARLVGEEEVPHWVVVTGIEDGQVTFHDPLASAGNTVGSASEFEGWLGFRGTSCAVIIQGRK